MQNKNNNKQKLYDRDSKRTRLWDKKIKIVKSKSNAKETEKQNSLQHIIKCVGSWQKQ